MSNLKSYHLFGKVKSTKECPYNVVIKNGEMSLGARTTDFLNLGEDCHFFDPSGNLTENSIYDIEKNLVRKYTFHYDSEGRILELISKLKNQVDFRVEYLYDKEIRNIGWKEFFEEFLCVISLYCFDKDGNIFGEDRYDEHSVLTAKIRDKLNEKGLCIESRRLTHDDELVEHLKYLYDNNGNLLERVFLFQDYCHKVVERYDNKRNIVEKITYASEHQIEKHQINEYKFDEYGNWIKKIQFEDNIPVKIIERVIEYYP